MHVENESILRVRCNCYQSLDRNRACGSKRYIRLPSGGLGCLPSPRSRDTLEASPVSVGSDATVVLTEPPSGSRGSHSRMLPIIAIKAPVVLIEPPSGSRGSQHGMLPTNVRHLWYLPSRRLAAGPHHHSLSDGQDRLGGLEVTPRAVSKAFQPLM